MITGLLAKTLFGFTIKRLLFTLGAPLLALGVLGGLFHFKNKSSNKQVIYIADAAREAGRLECDKRHSDSAIKAMQERLVSQRAEHRKAVNKLNLRLELNEGIDNEQQGAVLTIEKASHYCLDIPTTTILRAQAEAEISP